MEKIDIIDNIIIDYKYSCDTCNYKTNIKTSWNTHIMSDKHNRNGQKKSTKCDLCTYESTSHWNIKIHKKLMHLTKEEKEKQKYYCKTCVN